MPIFRGSILLIASAASIHVSSICVLLSVSCIAYEFTALPILVLRSLHFQLPHLKLSIYLAYLSVVRLLHFALLHFSLSLSLSLSLPPSLFPRLSFSLRDIIWQRVKRKKEKKAFSSVILIDATFQAAALIMREERVQVCATNACACDSHANDDPVDIMRRLHLQRASDFLRDHRFELHRDRRIEGKRRCGLAYGYSRAMHPYDESAEWKRSNSSRQEITTGKRAKGKRNEC